MFKGIKYLFIYDCIYIPMKGGFVTTKLLQVASFVHSFET
jgi:hypothetical protein